MKELSIIIPVYNVEKYLTKCIESILNQKYTDYEIILVNDGSTDDSAKICEKFKNENPSKIKYITKKNGGVSSARNIAIKESNSKYITFMDSDDYYLNNSCLEELLKKMKENELLIFNYAEVYTDNIRINNSKMEKKITKEEAFKYIFTSYKGFCCNKIFLTKIIKENGLLFDKNISICEDSLFLCQYMQYIKNIYITGKAYYGYRQRNTSATKKKISDINKIGYEKIDELFDEYKYDKTYFNYEYVSLYTKLNVKNKKTKDKLKQLIKSKKIDIKSKIKIIILYYLKFIFNSYIYVKTIIYKNQ